MKFYNILSHYFDIEQNASNSPMPAAAFRFVFELRSFIVRCAPNLLNNFRVSEIY